jgi:hypothetical protein
VTRSGKSSLCSAVAGELRLYPAGTSGAGTPPAGPAGIMFPEVNGQVAICTQQPWVENLSCRCPSSCAMMRFDPFDRLRPTIGCASTL